PAFYRTIRSDIVPAEIDDEILGARRSHILGVVELVRADVSHVAGPELQRLPRDRQLHRALADQHHLLAEMLVRRVIPLARRDIALVTLELEASVGLAGEHRPLTILAVGGHWQLIKDVGFGSKLRQLLDGGFGSRLRATLLPTLRRGAGGHQRG